jgi:hypothetical protein
MDEPEATFGPALWYIHGALAPPQVADHGLGTFMDELQGTFGPALWYIHGAPGPSIASSWVRTDTNDMREYA